MNYEFKGTPAPWTSGDGNAIFTDANNLFIALIPDGDVKQYKANKELVAASPLLLEACIDMIDKLCGDQEAEDELIKGLGYPVYHSMVNMKETIKKALNIKK